MTLTLAVMLWAVIVGTSFLSGVFGMAGGLVLVGVLLALLPLPAAMALHAVTQIASNIWRAALWRRHIVWPAVWPYAAGCVLALGAWSLTRYVPAKPVALLLLGVTPFLARAMPAGLRPNPSSLPQGLAYGSGCMTLLLMTGVAGPLADTFFLGGTMDRRAVVATKSACQVFGHAAKLAYFGAVIDDAATLDGVVVTGAILASMVGTTLARRLLEALTDAQFRTWANRIITAVGLYYIAQGAVLLGWPLVR